MDNLEYKGHWWLPENPDRKVAGILTFSQQNNGKLELIGSFQDVFDKDFNDDSKYSVILGQTTDGKLITLKDCLQTNYSFSMELTQETTFLVHFIYSDIHITDEDDFKFNKTQAKFTYLYDWVGVSGITRNFETAKKFQFTYTIPEDISIATEDGKIEITFGVNIKSHYDFANLNEQTSIFIECNQGKDLYEISQNYLFPLQSLISLGTTKPNFVEELYVFHVDFPKEPIKVYYSQHFYKPKVKDYLYSPDMLFTLGDIYEDLEVIINKWIALTKEIDSVLHLLNRVRIASDMFLELKFLSIAQAIETYHRTRRVNNYLPKDEHQKRVDQILRYLPKKYKELVRQKISNNEKSLLLRLEELSNEKAEIMNPIAHDLEKFTKKVRDSRNYYTHYGKSKKKNSAHGGDLYWLTEKLIMLLQACLLDEIDLPLEQQIQLFTRNQQYGNLRNK